MQILQQVTCELYKYSVAEFASFDCKIDIKSCQKGSGKVVESVMKIDQSTF